MIQITKHLPLVLNILSACLNMSGTILMFYNTPKISSKVFIYRHEELVALEARDKLRNKMTRLGMLLLFIGFLVQLLALIISESSSITNANK